MGLQENCSSLTSQRRQTEHSPSHDASQTGDLLDLCQPVRRYPQSACTTRLRRSGNLGESGDDEGLLQSCRQSVLLVETGGMEVDERWPTKKRGMNSKSPPASTVRKVSFRDQFCSLLESKQEFSPAEQKFFDSFLRPDKICPRDVSQKCSLQNSSNETGRAHFD